MLLIDPVEGVFRTEDQHVLGHRAFQAQAEAVLVEQGLLAGKRCPCGATRATASAGERTRTLRGSGGHTLHIHTGASQTFPHLMHSPQAGTYGQEPG